jgi:prepilin-type N-terminal cleavage/methylation domain-containing protein
MRRRKASGFTLIEVVIALVIGLAVLSAALSFVGTSYRSLGGNQVREEVYRNARYVAMSLERDMQLAGVALNSTPSFGTLAVWSDTVAVLRIPFDPNEAPVHALTPATDTTNPLPPGGTCGAYCVDVAKAGATFDLKRGDLARLQVNDERRLILVESVRDNANGSMAVEFTSHATLLHQPAGLSGGLRLDRFGTSVQRLGPIVYYRDSSRLMRAERLKSDGSMDGEVLAYGVEAFDVWLQFVDGHEAPEADPTGADPTSAYDEVTGARMQVTLAADHPDPRVNQGQVFTRVYEWRFTPRNLLWQRNRL